MVEMDVEKALAAAGAEGSTRKKEVERLHNKVWWYSLFLNLGILIAAIAPRLAPASRPAFVPSIPAGYGHLVTLVVFTAATMAVQEMLARVLQRRPAPAPRVAPETAWQLAGHTCMFSSMFFISYLSFGRDACYFVRSCSEWEVACLASVLNLVIATHTVVHYLA